MNNWNPTDPEIQTIGDFVQYLLDDELETFNASDLNALNKSLRRPVREIRTELESWGLTLASRGKSRRIRGVNTNSNDRFYGPGSDPMHGGSGWEQISGSAGREG